MTHSSHNRRRDRKTGFSRGTTIVETAVVLPVFLLFLFAIIEFGHAYMVRNMLASACRNGARIGSVEGDYGETTWSSCIERMVSSAASTGALETFVKDASSLDGGRFGADGVRPGGSAGHRPQRCRAPPVVYCPGEAALQLDRDRAHAFPGVRYPSEPCLYAARIADGRPPLLTCEASPCKKTTETTRGRGASARGRCRGIRLRRPGAAHHRAGHHRGVAPVRIAEHAADGGPRGRAPWRGWTDRTCSSRANRRTTRLSSDLQSQLGSLGIPADKVNVSITDHESPGSGFRSRRPRATT